MIRIIRFIITGSWHEHEWEELDLLRVNNSAHGGAIYERVYLRCKKCGNWKKEDLV